MIFQVRVSRSGRVAAVFVSYVEIYNDFCYDLLDPSIADNGTGESKQVRTPADGPAYIDRLTHVEVQSSDELLAQYMRGTPCSRIFPEKVES